MLGVMSSRRVMSHWAIALAFQPVQRVHASACESCPNLSAVAFASCDEFLLLLTESRKMSSYSGYMKELYHLIWVIPVQLRNCTKSLYASCVVKGPK